MAVHIEKQRYGNSTPRHRPGPFGPAKALLPRRRRLQFIHESEPTARALDLLLDDGLLEDESEQTDGDEWRTGSDAVKLPPEAQRVVLVTNDMKHVVGVFTWKSFGKRMCEIHSLRLDLSSLAVKDTDLEPPRFIDPDTYVDTAVNWREFDYVLVGSPSNVQGVLTVADVLGRLNDYAEAFVLLYEIEHEIRDMILDIYPESELAKVFEGLSDKADSPAEFAWKGLEALIVGDPPKVEDAWQAKKIQSAIKVLQKACETRPITDLKDFTFAQYREVIFNKDNWPRFEAVFDSPRELLNMDFEKINDLRNIVFHFRRGITPRDTDRLRRFRDKLRYNRDLYNKKPMPTES